MNKPHIILAIILLFLGSILFAQKQTYDIVKFSVPKGWNKLVLPQGIQFSIQNDGTGDYAAAVIVQHIASTASATDNFNNSWENLVKGTVKVTEAPHISDMDVADGWHVLSGQANYTDGGTQGVAMLITATGNEKMANVVIMTNTSKYQEEILAFVNSLEITEKAIPNTNSTNSSITNSNSANRSVAGLWVDNHLETSGYANGYPQYTAGYFRREYLFNENGTYIFRAKNWSAYMKEILFVYETGNYTIQGNQITITPQKGMGEWWSKKDNNTSLWGSRLKSSTYKAEKETYTFEVKYYSGSKDYALLLDPKKTTERDGTYNGPNSFSYKKWEDGVSKIDNPPGFKAWSVDKPGVSAANSSTNNSAGNKSSIATSPNVAANNKIAGLWIDYNPELAANPYNTNYAGMRNSTGGYRNKEYQFFNDGTYLYRKKYWVTTMKEILYAYETGTYSINGNQLTITPQKGKSEWWSKDGAQTNTWGKFLKAAEYKLEKTTYTFVIKYYAEGQTTSITIKPLKPTERDGGQFNAANDPLEFHYHLRNMESLMDNPPGYPKEIKTKS